MDLVWIVHHFKLFSNLVVICNMWLHSCTILLFMLIVFVRYARRVSTALKSMKISSTLFWNGIIRFAHIRNVAFFSRQPIAENKWNDQFYLLPPAVTAAAVTGAGAAGFGCFSTGTLVVVPFSSWLVLPWFWFRWLKLRWLRKLLPPR